MTPQEERRPVCATALRIMLDIVPQYRCMDDSQSSRRWAHKQPLDFVPMSKSLGPGEPTEVGVKSPEQR